MNETCNGVFFTADNHNYYRCLLDGSAIEAPLNTARCLKCGRVIDTLTAIPRQVEVNVLRFVFLPGIHGKVFLPDEPIDQSATDEDIEYTIRSRDFLHELDNVTNVMLTEG